MLNSPVHRKEYDHMENVISPVRGVCPKTGEYIDVQEVPRDLVINHFFQRLTNLAHPLDKYRDMGIEHMTEQMKQSAYNIIKEYKSCKIV